jgi:hypothetical protein
MRAALALASFLAVLATGCSSDPYFYDEHPGRNAGTDLRPGDYDLNAGYDPLPISNPRPASTSSIPDRPWVERAPEVNPVHAGVTPVAPSRLVALLPAPPAGWVADEANGVTLTTPTGALTEASRMYWKSGAIERGPTPDGRDLFPSIGITIVDRGQAGSDAASPGDEERAVTLRNVEVEGVKGHEFEAGPGFKQFDAEVAGRYFVRVRGGHVTFEELRAWAAKVKLKDLASLN